MNPYVRRPTIPAKPRSGLLLGLVVALALAGASRAAAPPTAAAASKPLSDRLARALAVPHVDGARTAAVALDLQSGRVVFARRAARSLAPASTEKLAVSYSLLALLGPRHRIETRVLGEGRVEDGSWRGRLVLKGYGDPTLSSSDLRTLAWKVRAQGVRRVVGPIVGDESFFDARRTAPGWRSWFSGAYCAPISALAVRGRASRRPALAAAESFRAALRAAGVSVTGPATPGRARASAAVLATTASAPLSSLLSLVNRESDNFAAEVLLKHLGAVQLGRGTTAGGATVVRETLDASRIPLAGVRFVDGSGLSLLDRSTAQALVGILATAWGDSYTRTPFLRSLAVAGRSGTLSRRLRTRDVAGRVLAKTGTTRAASALAGFVGDRYAFAIVQNGSPVSWFWARVAQDRFVRVLAGAQ